MQFTSFITTAFCGLFAVLSLTQAQTTPPATEPSPASGEDRPRMVSLQIATVGPVVLRSFGKTSPPPAKPRSTTPPPAPVADGQDPATTTEQAPPDSAEAAGGSTDFGVIDQDPDEIPPHQFFVKNYQGKYERIICSLNSVSSAVEFPVMAPELVVYTRIPPKKASEEPKYKKFCNFPLPAGDRKVLITITKPLKTKKWNEPVIQAHDLTDVPDRSITIINTAMEQVIGCNIEGEKKMLAPKRGRLTYASSNGKPVAHVSAVSKYSLIDKDTKELIPFLDKYFQTKRDRKMLILVYSVSKAESPMGAKYIRVALDS